MLQGGVQLHQHGIHGVGAGGGKVFKQGYRRQAAGSP
jgi:hypothetical protein